MVVAPSSTSFKIKDPSFFVRILDVVLSTVTTASGTGLLSELLTTFPVIVVCANAGTLPHTNTVNNSGSHILLFVIFVIYSANIRFINSYFVSGSVPSGTVLHVLQFLYPTPQTLFLF